MSARRYLKATIAALASGGAMVGLGLAINQVNLERFDQRSMIWLGVALALAIGTAAITAYKSGSDTHRPIALSRTDHADRETFDLTTPGERLRMLLLLSFKEYPWGSFLGVLGALFLVALGALWVARDTGPVRDLLVPITGRGGEFDPYTVLEYVPLIVAGYTVVLVGSYVMTWFEDEPRGGRDRVIIDPHGFTVLDLRRIRRSDRSYSVEWADLEKARAAPTADGSDHAILIIFKKDRDPGDKWHERTGLEYPNSDGLIAFRVSPDLRDEHGSPVLPRLRDALARFGPAARTETDS
ncbi:MULTISPECIES: hypothetical protein [unclassified Nocardiopsis]|uniref:hypothetical protein n=1 Tax=Nocardiopsis TaxID=2013 RepID=UPI00387B6E49